MKTLITVRHAKSSWATIGQKDFDRPLNERGKKDAVAMAKKLLKDEIAIDAFVSSPAKRAYKTCKAFAKAYGRKKEDIIFFEKLYHAYPEVFYDVINELDDKEDTVALFGHNPGITDFVNTLCKNVHTAEMPTCAIFAVKADVPSWKDFKSAEKQLLFFKYPKEV